MMKKIATSMLFLMFLVSAVAQKTYVPDNNFEQCLIDAGYDDLLDDYVTTANISGVLHLVVNSKNISDLTGLEGFTSLIDIDCRDNQITSVDLSQNTVLKMFNAGNNNISSLDLSHNTELTYLNCSDNEFTSLNVSQNSKLTFLKCDANNISSLNVGLLTNLNNLECQHNQITSLDVSGKASLENLNCGKNNLTELDLSSNIALKYLECDSNKISSLNLSHNAALKHLVCSSNKLTSLDISNKTSLTGVECVNNALVSIDLLKSTALEELYCSMNQLTSLDVSNNTSLTMLDCGANPITELDFSKNTNLTMLYFYGNYVTDVDLSNNSALTMVFAGYNNQLRTLNVANGSNSLITYFNASNSPNLSCIIVDNPATANSGAAPYNTWIKDEKATYTDVCTVGGNTYVPDDNFEQALIDLGIDSDGTIDDSVSTANIYATTYLDISNKNISDLTGIEEFIYLDTLLVSGNQLTGFDISQNAKLKTFRCDNNQLDSINLSYNNLLTEINCSNNQLTNLIFWNNNTLTKIYCNNNQLASLDMREYKVLNELNCSNNQLTHLIVQNGTNSLITLFDATNNPALTCIPVDNPADANNGLAPYDTWLKDASATYSERCDIPGMTYIPDNNFEQALINLGIDKDGTVNNSVATADIESVTTLFISNKNISDLTGIEDFDSLLYLSCSSNPITALNISHNSLLKSLSCYSNKLTELNISQNDSLVTIHCGHNSLTTLDLSNNLKLTSLDCNSNDLTSLDVSKNTLFTTLNITNNQITEIDVSNNVALENLECYFNQISELDVSKNSALRSLYCSDNQLTHLNAGNGNNEIFTRFDATNNPDLTCIRVDNPAAANAGMASYELWVKDATAVYSNDCSGAVNAYVPDDNFEQALIDLGIDTDGTLNDSVAKADVAGVTTLNVSLKEISNLTGIEYFTDLTRFSCAGNQLTSLDLRQNIGLKYLNCIDNQIDTLNFSFNPDLDTLRADNNQLNTLDVSKNSSLKFLSFMNNHLERIDLKNNPELNYLNCESNILYSLDVTANTALTYLQCNSNQLYSLDLTNNSDLTILFCLNNHLGSLDLTQNDALEKFYCSNNELKNIDLTGNMALKSTHLDNNKLTNIDVTGLTALEELMCYQNKITDLDLSMDTVLKTLGCSNNSLSNLNVKNGNNGIIVNFNATSNPDLTCIQVDSAANANNGAAPYDNWQKDALAEYSENCVDITVINDANFEQALIDLGIITDSSVDGRVVTDEIASVTKLDLSDLNISDLTGIADFTDLDTLIVSNNQITYLDLTLNTNLVYLDISGNPITTLFITDSDILKAASSTEAVNETNENLLYIDISGTDIASIDISNVPNLELFIANGSKLASLDVSNNANLTDVDLRDCPLDCIQVSQVQFDNIPAGWQKEDTASYSTDCSATTGIDERSGNGISLHPNPASGILYVDSDVPLTKIEFYSVTGEIVKVVTSDFSTVNVSDLQKGAYIVRVFTEDGVIVKKLLKK